MRAFGAHVQPGWIKHLPYANQHSQAILLRIGDCRIEEDHSLRLRELTYTGMTGNVRSLPFGSMQEDMVEGDTDLADEMASKGLNLFGAAEAPIERLRARNAPLPQLPLAVSSPCVYLPPPRQCYAVMVSARHLFAKHQQVCRKERIKTRLLSSTLANILAIAMLDDTLWYDMLKAALKHCMYGVGLQCAEMSLCQRGTRTPNL